MVGTPMYYGPAERRRFAMVHTPAAGSGPAVVLCPPLAYEAVCAHAALLDLADLLADAGCTVVRIDYDGTGNSVGSDTDPDRVEAWLASVDDAVSHLVDRGWETVTLVGLRIGATLAASVAARRDEVTRAVLWDPYLSGRRFARAQKLMAATAEGGGSDDGGVVVAGLRFSPDTLTGLSGLRIRPEDLPSRVLALRPVEGTVDTWPDLAGPGREVREVTGTRDLLDTDVELAVVPEQALREIVAWERTTRDPGSATGTCTHAEAGSATEDVAGSRITHRARRIGPDRLFAVETVPEDRARGRRTAVVFLNNGSAPQPGPGGAWVEWGRRLAADGAIVLRADLSGLGDSAAVDGAPVHDSYPLAAGRNIAAMVTHVRELGAEHVVLVGLCSGALLAFDGLLATPDVDVVVSINGRFDKAWTHSRADRHLRAAGRTSRVLAFPLRKTPLFPVFQKVPHPVWQALAGLHLVAAPTRAFRSVRHHRARLLLVFGAHELGIAALEARDVAGWRATKASDQVTISVVEGLDHSMFEVTGRDRVYDVVHRYLRDDRRLL